MKDAKSDVEKKTRERGKEANRSPQGQRGGVQKQYQQIFLCCYVKLYVLPLRNSRKECEPP